MVDISKVDIDRIENLQKELKLYLPLIGGIISGNLSVDGKFQLNNLNNLNKTANKIAVFNDSGEIDFRTASEIKDDINAGAVDNITITQDNSDKMQVIGTLEKNKQSAKYDWIGTLAEYNAQNIEKTHPTWVCFITDDFTGSGEADKGSYTKDEIDAKLINYQIKQISQTLDTNTEKYPSNKAVHDFITNNGSGGEPGDIVASLGTSRKNALLCDGRSVSKTTYTKLWNVIQYKYGGSGDNFNLPDLRNYYLVGAGTSIANLGVKVGAGLPNITGEFGTGEDNYAIGAFKHIGNISGGTAMGGSSDYKVDFNASRSSSIYGASTTVRPQSVGVNYFILY